MKPLLFILAISCCYLSCQNTNVNTPNRTEETTKSFSEEEDTAVIYYTNAQDSLSVEDTLILVNVKAEAGDTIVLTDTVLLAKEGEEEVRKSSTKPKKQPKDVDGNPWTLTYPELEALINRENDTVYIYNFWATWCKPCIAELPYFEQLNRAYAHKKVKVVLVSLDFPELLNYNLIPYVKEHGIRSKVYLLDAGNPNEWVDKVSRSWSGAIPATLVVHSPSKRRSFYEQSFDYEALESIVKRSL